MSGSRLYVSGRAQVSTRTSVTPRTPKSSLGSVQKSLDTRLTPLIKRKEIPKASYYNAKRRVFMTWREAEKENLDETRKALGAAKTLKKEIRETLEAGLRNTHELFEVMITTLETQLDEQEKCQNSAVIEKVEEQSRLLLETQEMVKDIKANIEKQHEAGVAPKTYAEAITSGPSLKAPAALHSLVVSSEDDQMTGEEVLTRLREAVDAKEGWTKVERVRKAKDRKVVMAFATTTERAKVRERVEAKGKGLLVEEVQNRDPLLVLRGVLSVNTDEDILKALKNQNRELFDDLDQESCRVKVRYRRKARNPHTAHVVLETSPPLWNRITNAAYVHIDLQRVKAEDQSPLVQCSRCLAYGHSKRFCVETEDACSHCGGPHLKADCVDFAASVPPSCRNCRRAKLDSIQHNAFSSDCPVRGRWDELARSSVAYC